MSVTSSLPSLPFRITTTVLSDGERRVYMVDDRGLEDDYSALFVVSQLRNDGLSVASEEQALSAINVLHGFCREWGIDLLDRFRAGEYLTTNECEALGDFTRHDFGAEFKKQQKVVALGKGRRGYVYSRKPVARETQRKRLRHIAAYVSWLGKYLLTHVSSERRQQVEAMRVDILGQKLLGGARRDDFDAKKHFTAAHNARLNTIIAPGAPENPFEEHVQLRNLCLIEVLRHCGLRRGEALNLRVRDIDHVKRVLKVRRRHDSPDDPRVKQPNPKTLERDLSISAYLIDLIVEYVAIRKRVPGAKKHQYLFVTHKAGPTQGQPISTSAVEKVVGTIASVDKNLAHLTAHKFRHFFSSELADEQQLKQGTDANSRELHRRVRNYLAGRKATSEVDALYTEHHTKREAQRIAEQLQARMPPPVAFKRKHE